IEHDRLDQHEVISLTDNGKYGPMLTALGIPVTCLNMPRGRLTFAGIWQLLRKIRRVRPDVVQTWMYHAELLSGMLASIAGCRNVVWGIHHTNLDPELTIRSSLTVARACAYLSRIVSRKFISCAQKS